MPWKSTDRRRSNQGTPPKLDTMARPLRIEFAGALYHVTSRGDRQEPIFQGDPDRRILLAVIDQAMNRLDAEAFAFCLMGNHYHLVVRTRRANLSRLMRQINGEYTRAVNRRYGYTGHLFQGRFHAVLVDSDEYLMQVCRYVDLNPVRAAMVADPAHWPWSSYRAHVGMELGHSWLATSELHGYLLGRDVKTVHDQRQAARLYAKAVTAGIGADLWRSHLKNELFLGGEAFARKMQALAAQPRLACTEINRQQRMEASTLASWLASDRTTQESIRLAYSAGGMTMTAIAREAGVSTSTVSRAIRAAEAATCKT